MTTDMDPISQPEEINNEPNNSNDQDINGDVHEESNTKKKVRRKKNHGDKKVETQKVDPKKSKSKKQNAQSAFAKKIAEAQLELERVKQREEEERRRQEEERQKELERIRLEEERKERKKQKEKERKKRLKQEGKILSKAQRERNLKNKEILKRMMEQGATCGALSQPDNVVRSPSPVSPKNDQPQIRTTSNGGTSESNSVSESKELGTICDEIQSLQIKPLISDPVLRIKTRKLENAQPICTDKLRPPILCVMGHVDTGKTKILDKLRNTNVQVSEAGGITQQIGVTNVPLSAIKESVRMCSNMDGFEYQIMGLSIIDTPGHFSFRNLRSLGSSLCDMAILVVDIMHSIESQTEESVKLLLQRKTPFVVALNKIDLIVDWKSMPNESIVETIAKQSKQTRAHFEDLFRKVFVNFSELGINLALFTENKDPGSFVSAVPTSARTGDGIGDLITYIVRYSQENLSSRLIMTRELEATIMEVKMISGLGSTIDVILVNGVLNKGDRIIVPSINGPITSQIRALLTPQPMKEMRVKGSYVHHDSISVSQGVKIAAPNLDNAIAGLPIFVAMYEDEIEYFEKEMSSLIDSALRSFEKSDTGVYVQASTLGSLEAMLDFLSQCKVPYFGYSIGPVHKRDVINALVMLEHDPIHAVILAFDVKVDPEAQTLADKSGIRIFTADIIYHLYDDFMKYEKEFKKKRADQVRHLAVFPCTLRILPEHIYKSRDPIVVGVIVEDGTARVGTTLCVPSRNNIVAGVIAGIEINHKTIDIAKKGQEACIKIATVGDEAPKLLGRHFEVTDQLVSKISRESIDIMKEYFRDELTKQDWLLIKNLKTTFGIL